MQYNKFLHSGNRSVDGLGVMCPLSNWNILLTRVRIPTPAAWRPGEIRILYALSTNRDIDTSLRLRLERNNSALRRGVVSLENHYFFVKNLLKPTEAV